MLPVLTYLQRHRVRVDSEFRHLQLSLGFLDGRLDGLPQVFLQVFNIFDADAEAHKTWISTRIGCNTLLYQGLYTAKTCRRLQRCRICSTHETISLRENTHHKQLSRVGQKGCIFLVLQLDTGPSISYPSRGG